MWLRRLVQIAVVMDVCRGLVQEVDTNLTGQQCQRPKQINHGYYQGPSSFTLPVSTTLHARCNNGYHLQGNTTRTCLSDGTWSGADPQCSAVKCDIPLESHAEFNSAGIFNPFMDTATYNMTFTVVCDQGYRTVVSSVKCESNGQWSAAGPYCFKNSSNPDILHKNCTGPTDLQNGLYFYNNTNDIQIAQATCNVGYTLNVNGTRICQQDGTWSGVDPQCSAVKCDIPLESHAEFNPFMDTASSNMTFTVVCDQGYRTVVSSVKCGSHGQWSAAGPYCIKTSSNPDILHKKCTGPTDIKNGLYFYNNTNDIQIAQATCNVGFTLHVNGTRICQQDGTWSGEDPQCSAVKCDIPLESHAKLNSAGVFNPFMDTASFNMTFIVVCDQGYRTVVSSVKCGSNGQWSSPSPYCVEAGTNTTPTTLHKDCTIPNDLQNGVYSSTTTDAQGHLTIHALCNENYRLQGNGTRVCQSDGFWDGKTPICSIVTCDIPLETRAKFVSNHLIYSYTEIVVYNTIVNIQCDTGFVGVVSNIRCLGDGQWSAKGPYCFKNQTNVSSQNCSIPIELQYGQYTCNNNTLHLNRQDFFQYNTVLEIVCDQGYRSTVPTNTILCTTNGQWNANPSCIKVNCSVPLLMNGYYTTRQNTGVVTVVRYSDTIRPVCANGSYRLQTQGGGERFCMADGLFNGTDPVCELTKTVAPRSDSQRKTAIAAGVGGGSGGVVLVAAVIGWFMYKRRKNSSSDSSSTETDSCITNINYELDEWQENELNGNV